MKVKIFTIALVMLSSFAFAQSGHLMQGIGAVNMSMGGASTAQPLDISGALQWNPASISGFSGTKIGLDVGMMFSSPTLSSSRLANPMAAPSDMNPMLSGSTDSDKGVSPLPSLAIVWGKEDSKHTFGVSVFGVSGFGVDFAENGNFPGYSDGTPNPSFDPTKPTNPINYPQSAGGFGHINSNYMLLQVGFTWAYQITEKLSIGVEPTFNYHSLEIAPNPLVQPGAAGYISSESTSAMGYGAQVGIFYDTQTGFKIGASYKTQQFMAAYAFEGDDTNGNIGKDFTMNFPAIASIGVGYSNDMFDLALDYRRVMYSSTDGFEDTGWNANGTVKGFGWQDMNVVSAGIQLNLVEKMPIRLGYTYSSNPIDGELIMYSVSAPAIIKHAFQFGLGYDISEKLTLNGLFHYGTSGEDATKGQMLNPMMSSPNNPYGKVPNTEVSAEMTTMLISLGVVYTL